jgi:hypothetical protein
MQYEAYPFVYNKENTRFKFQSKGRRGVFEKVVFITPISDEMYNLALVDYNAATDEYSDQTITDNGDMPQVLATVLKRSIHFWIRSRIRLFTLKEARLHEQDCIKLQSQKSMITMSPSF